MRGMHSAALVHVPTVLLLYGSMAESTAMHEELAYEMLSGNTTRASRQPPCRSMQYCNDTRRSSAVHLSQMTSVG